MADLPPALDGVILRRWRGRIRTAEREAYAAYIARTGGSDYRSTPGNIAYQMTMRDLGDGSSEVVTLSWWRSLDAIRAFAGDPIDVARYYPEDDHYLLERPLTVEHHHIVAGAPGFAKDD
jgi:heme-degrading monooxygenase HmoA